MLARTKVVFLVAALGAGTAIAQEKKPAEPAKAPAAQGAPAPAMDPKMSPEMQKNMEASIRASTPGPEHEKLKAMVGTFDTKFAMWTDPKAPPMESTGTTTNKMIFGDRFLMQEFTGNFMGQPLNALTITGYDNLRKKYTSMWIDSQMTSMLTGDGTAGKDGTITMNTPMLDVMTGKARKAKSILKMSGTGYTMELWGPPMSGKGKDVKHIEMTFTRK
jgi:hypothetical protein